MADKSLAGKKIAVLVEAQYIPAEIKIYQERFASYGADRRSGLAAVGPAEAALLQHLRAGRRRSGRMAGGQQGLRRAMRSISTTMPR